MIPNSVPQLLITLVLVIPGFVYQETRIRLRGRKPGDADVTSRLLSAIAASLFFALGYTLLLGPVWADRSQAASTVLAHPRAGALLAVLAAFVLPVLAAAAPNLPRTWAEWRHPLRSLRVESLTRYDARPSAWDVAFQGAHECYVRVRMRDGTWFAGYFGPASYASSFPDPRSLYVELEYDVDDEGKIGSPVQGSVGSVIDCVDAVLVELLAPGGSDKAQWSDQAEE